MTWRNHEPSLRDVLSLVAWNAEKLDLQLLDEHDEDGFEGIALRVEAGIKRSTAEGIELRERKESRTASACWIASRTQEGGAHESVGYSGARSLERFNVCSSSSWSAWDDELDAPRKVLAHLERV